MAAIGRIASRHDLPIIEDASQALGARWRGRTVGSLGTAGVFSISTLKPVSSFHGGVVVTDDDGLATRLRAAVDAWPTRPRSSLPRWLARDYAMHVVSQPAVLGTVGWPLLRWAERRAPEAVRAFQRGRLCPSDDAPGGDLQGAQVPAAWQISYSDYQADLALAALERLAVGTARRQRLAGLLTAELRERHVPGLAAVEPDSEPIYWRLPLWVDDVRAVRAGLAARGVDTTTTNLRRCGPGTHAEAFVERAIFLPLHPELRASDMVHIAAAVADTLADCSDGIVP
jgi:dTDP-4-amino-4,6-dideoxygalactose transaminase